MAIDLSVIIVNWNSKDYLRSCLTSVFAHTSLSLEVVVIDSGSFDGCEQMLREHHSQVRFIESADNLGFAKANNRAFIESTGDCVLFLNPDTELSGPAIDTLFARLNSLPNCGAVGGKLLNSDGTIQYSSIQAMPTILNRLLDCDSLKTRWPRSSLWGMAPLYESAKAAVEVEAISGACVMLKRSVFEEVGRFSEDYFMYAEDVDLSHKVRMAGYQNYYVPEATLIHHGGSSSKESANTFTAVMMPEATLRFLRKTRGAEYALCYRVVMCASALGRLIALGLAVTFGVGGCRNPSEAASFRKWLAVLRWSLSRDELVKKYYPTANHPCS
jgi:N-acetylglucosaminyl-diphospho-decaprenol L-rhamnosyltransferase